jgi:hypothetical protein
MGQKADIDRANRPRGSGSAFTGSGVLPQYRDRVFEAFFTSKPEGM